MDGCMYGAIDRRARICEDAVTGTEYVHMYVCMEVGGLHAVIGDMDVRWRCVCMVRRDSYSEACDGTGRF